MISNPQLKYPWETLFMFSLYFGSLTPPLSLSSEVPGTYMMNTWEIFSEQVGKWIDILDI